MSEKGSIHDCRAEKAHLMPKHKPTGKHIRRCFSRYDEMGKEHLVLELVKEDGSELEFFEPVRKCPFCGYTTSRRRKE